MSRNSGPIFNPVPDQTVIEQKRQQLAKYPRDLWAQQSDSGTTELLMKASEFLCLEPTTSIRDLALTLEEDIALMNHGRLVALCFCFPSSWIPAEKIGLSLAQIHSAVADGQKLTAASDKLAATMADPALGSFRRQVWTVTATAGLSNHPQEKNHCVPNSINDLFFRLETQTTHALDQHSSLFFVKVEVCALTEIWQQWGHKITASVNSMTHSVLAYKNLHSIKAILNRTVIL